MDKPSPSLQAAIAAHEMAVQAETASYRQRIEQLEAEVERLQERQRSTIIASDGYRAEVEELDAANYRLHSENATLRTQVAALEQALEKIAEVDPINPLPSGNLRLIARAALGGKRNGENERRKRHEAVAIDEAMAANSRVKELEKRAKWWRNAWLNERRAGGQIISDEEADEAANIALGGKRNSG